MPTNKCIICSVSFRSWHEYNGHMAEHLKADSPLAPIKTSNRTKAQIVQDMECEPWFRPHLIGHDVDKLPQAKPKVEAKIEIVHGFDDFPKEVLG